MLVHRKKKFRYAIQAPLTSLIDIVFMLLIYFLLTTNFMVDELGLSGKQVSNTSRRRAKKPARQSLTGVKGLARAVAA